MKRKQPTYAKELTADWTNRKWKTTRFGRQKYFPFPLTEEGYKQALIQFRQYIAEHQLSAKRSEGQSDQVQMCRFDTTVNQQVAQYLNHLLRRVRGTAKVPLSPQRYAATQSLLKHFTREYGERSVQSLNSGDVRWFADVIWQAVTDEKMTVTTASTVLAIVSSFIRWLWQNDVLETLPRNIRELSVTVPKTKPKVITKEEIKSLLEAGDDVRRLYILLMLNCGMTQKDIADLRQSEVDWQTGRITRIRSKRQHAENPPIVEYVLWRETFQLLVKQRSTTERVLLTRKGTPLVEEQVIENGFARSRDTIYSKFLHFPAFQSLKERGISPKHFRKTAASMLDAHPEFSRFAQHFLGHTPVTIAERHYVVPSQERFDAAVKWLGEQFGY